MNPNSNEKMKEFYVPNISSQIKNKRIIMKHVLTTFAIVVVAVLVASYLQTKVLKF